MYKLICFKLVLFTCLLLTLKPTKAQVAINTDGSVDVDDDVQILRHCKQITIKFGKIDGDFSCYNSALTSLENCPVYVSGHFNCASSYITSLKHCPKYVGDDFDCADIEIKETTEYRYVLFGQVGGDISTGISSIDNTLNEYKNKLHLL